MLGSYRSVFHTPGAASFCAAGFVMRMPIGMYPIGLVLILSARDGRYGFAGVLGAVYVLANGIGNPVLARVSDRMGQRRLLLVASAVHVVAAVVLSVFVSQHWADWTLVGPTVVTGFSFLAVGSLVRARWSFVLAGSAELGTAYSLESALDEIIFVVGPLIATTIATQLRPVLVLYLAAGLVAVGAVWMSTLRTSEPPAGPVGSRHPRSAVRSRGMPLLVVFAAAMGAILSSAEVTIVAFCGQHEHRGLSGVVLAAMALGSAVSAFLYGAQRWRADLLDRFRLQALIFGVLPALFFAATGVGVLAVCAFVVGAGIAPMLITAFALIERLVPGASLTEGLAWLLTGLSVGYGIGASLVGGIADAHGARTAFLVTVVAGLVMAALGVLQHARLRSPAPEAFAVG